MKYIIVANLCFLIKGYSNIDIQGIVNGILLGQGSGYFIITTSLQMPIIIVYNVISCNIIIHYCIDHKDEYMWYQGTIKALTWISKTILGQTISKLFAPWSSEGNSQVRKEETSNWGWSSLSPPSWVPWRRRNAASCLLWYRWSVSTWQYMSVRTSHNLWFASVFCTYVRIQGTWCWPLIVGWFMQIAWYQIGTLAEWWRQSPASPAESNGFCFVFLTTLIYPLF